MKWIYKDAMLSQFWNVGEQVVGENLCILANAGQEQREDRAIQHAIRMIGHHHDRARRRNARLIGGIHAKSDSHFGEQALQAKSNRRLLDPSIEITHTAYRSKPRGQTG